MFTREREKEASGERRREALANKIADALVMRGLDACPGDCSCGVVCVVIFHHETPDPDARGVLDVDDNDGNACWEEHLLYEGRQIRHAATAVHDIDATSDDRETVLAVMRTLQDRDTWK